MKDGKDYDQARKFINRAPKSTSSYELTNIQTLMAYLGNVQDKLRVVHVAGTNGKGSVCACICCILQEAGYRTGLYSSPAVFDEEEIIKINGVQISKQDFAEVTAAVQAACVKMQQEGLDHPTAFEIETAVAFYYFYREKCDFAVVEAGMGGTLDATNIITHPVCSVITSVSRDHMAFLGETLEEIAAAKAGIIKPGCPCVTAWQEPEVLKALKSIAESNGSELWEAQDELVSQYGFDSQKSFFLLPGHIWHPTDRELSDKDRSCPPGESSEDTAWQGRIHCALTGAWQRGNLVCVLTAIRLMRKKGISISGKAVVKGLSSVRLPGRFERIHEKPDIYIDGAHNEGAALLLKETVQNCFTNTKIVYIIGVLADKEYEKALQLLAPYAARIFTVTPDHPRALDGEKLAKAARRYHSHVSCMPSMEQAVRRAADAAGRKGVVLAFGSFSYLGKLRQAVKDIL